MAVLYRKYRPQTFADVVNQKHIIQTLKNQVAAGKPAHAYLFTGSRGVGKTSVARILAKAVNCLHSDESRVTSRGLGDACGVCEVCKQIKQGSFLDLIEVDAASNTGVENVRDLIEHVKFSPSSGKYKVFIIDEVHMLSKQAFNALLKTLEEPPKHAIFILATTEINKVLPTIISRTQRFDFKALSAADILERLKYVSKQEGLNFQPEILDLVAQNSEGSGRDALSLLDKLVTLGEALSLSEAQQLLGVTDAAVCEQLLEFIAMSQAGALPDFFTDLLQKGADMLVFNRDFLEYLRKILVYKITGGKQSSGLAGQHEERLKDLSGQMTVLDIIFTTRLFLRSYKELDSSPSQEIPLLLAALEAALHKPQPGKQAMPLPAPVRQPIVASEEGINSPANDSPSAAIMPVPAAAEAKRSLPAEDVTALEQSPAADTISLVEAESIWPKLIEDVKKINGPLANLLKSCGLCDVLENKIIVKVKFLFNKQHLENFKNAQMISEILFKLSGKNLAVSARVDRDDQPVIQPVAAISDALKVFGGELIE